MTHISLGIREHGLSMSLCGRLVASAVAPVAGHQATCARCRLECERWQRRHGFRVTTGRRIVTSAGREAVSELVIVPITLREAAAFIDEKHRHHDPPRGWKFGIGVVRGERLVGVATAGRPVARAYGKTVIEVNRTCTDGTPNANSMLYGAARRAAVAMGYKTVYSYTEHGESGASLRAAGFRIDAHLPARPSWSGSSVKLKDLRNPVGTGGVERIRWVWP